MIPAMQTNGLGHGRKGQRCHVGHEELQLLASAILLPPELAQNTIQMLIGVRCRSRQMLK